MGQLPREGRIWTVPSSPDPTAPHSTSLPTQFCPSFPPILPHPHPCCLSLAYLLQRLASESLAHVGRLWLVH